MADGNAVHPLLELPEEVRGAIFNKLPQHDALNVRLVCKQWLQEINKYFEFNIRLDDRSPFMGTILKLHIKNCQVVHFRRTVPPAHRPASIFKYLKDVQTLGIQTDGVHAKSWQAILKSSAKYISNLSLRREWIKVDFHMIFQWLESADFDFINLLKLQLIIRHLLPRDVINPRVTTQEAKLLQQFHGLPEMPKLKYLTLGFASCPPELAPSLIMFIIRLIVKYRNSLASVDIELPQNQFLYDRQWSGTGLDELSSSDPYTSIDSLSKLRIQASVCPLHFKLWTELIARQTKLVDIEVHLRGRRICRLSFQLFQQVVLSNLDTLVNVAMHNLDIDPNTLNANAEHQRPLDLALFQNCSSLRNLKLGRCFRPVNFNFAFAVRQLRVPHVAEIINLLDLPKGLVELELNNFFIPTADLLAYSSDPCSSLKKLVLNFCGYEGGFGVNGTVLESILQNTHLVEVWIRGLRVQGSDSEMEKLKSILNSLEMDRKAQTRPIYLSVPGTYCTHLKRESIDEAWKIKELRDCEVTERMSS